MAHRLGVDIGGTFTDFAILDTASGRLATHKQLTTPDDPSVAVLAGLDTVLAREGLPIGDLQAVIHGTTLVTNATIERKGARVCMLVTAGFPDVLTLAKETRYDLYDLRLRFAAPVVPRSMRLEVDERIRYDGSVDAVLDLDGLRRSFAALRKRERIEAVAVCFLHSYANPAHERAVQQMIRAEHPDLHVSVSSEISAVMREYERWTTTTVNAYNQPMIDRYLGALESGLARRGFTGKFHLMTSNGGTVTSDVARRFPVRLMESGPAAGVLMSARHGRQLGIPDLLSFDMGGTTSKGALLSECSPLKHYQLEVARCHHFKRGSGLPILIPVIDMIEIGIGGGSIAAVDKRGVVRAGPHSAGARPGPACYGQGGAAATLTDANLLLGYLDPGFFLGGRMQIAPEASAYAIEHEIGRPLGLSVLRSAWGIHETANEDVARAYGVHAAERGFDYHACTMLAFGRAGPILPRRIARHRRSPLYAGRQHRPHARTLTRQAPCPPDRRPPMGGHRMTTADHEAILADEPLDDLDERILMTLKVTHEATDPPPPGLTERITYALSVAALEAEVAHIVAQSQELAGVRSTAYERTSTVTFANDGFSVMVTIDAATQGLARVTGWTSDPGIEVELRERARSRSTTADDRGRFAFGEVERGLVHFLFRWPEPEPRPPVITPAFEI